MNTEKVNNLYSNSIKGNFVFLSIQTTSSPRATVGTTLSWNIAEQVSLQSKVVLWQRWIINSLHSLSFFLMYNYLLSADFVLSSIDFWENGPTVASFVWLVPSASCLLRYSLYAWPMISKRGMVIVKIIHTSIILTYAVVGRELEMPMWLRMQDFS